MLKPRGEGLAYSPFTPTTKAPRVHRFVPGVRSWMVTLLISATIPFSATAGPNAGAVATLSWAPDHISTDVPVPQNGALRLYVAISGLAHCQSVALTLNWTPTVTDSGYEVISDTLTAGNCGRVIRVAPGHSFSGDSTYGWTIVTSSEDCPACVSHLLTSVASAPRPARICLVEAFAMDSTGAIDPILASNSLTIAGGANIPACPITLYAASPATLSAPNEPMSSLVNSHNENAPPLSAPFVTMLGNNMDSVTGVAVMDSHGRELSGTILDSRTTNSLTASFPELPGFGPWDIAVQGSEEVADTLRGALSIGNAAAASFVQLAELPSEYMLPNSAVDPWSPNGHLVGLKGPDGLYVYDIAQGEAPPVRVLEHAVDYFTWSPDGTWLLCLVPEPGPTVSDYASLFVASADGLHSEELLRRADIGPFMWTEDGTIRCWYAHSPIERVFSPPEAWARGTSKAATVLSRIRFVPSALPDGHMTLGSVSSAGRVATLPSISHVGVTTYIPRQELPRPDASALVTMRIGPGPLRNVLLASDGSIARELGDCYGPDGFIATTISPDGRYCLGFREITSPSGDDIANAPLYMKDMNGDGAVLSVAATGGTSPRFSPTGYHVVFADLKTGRVRLGVVHVER